jgi:iron complex outermembrane recepter protein
LAKKLDRQFLSRIIGAHNNRDKRRCDQTFYIYARLLAHHNSNKNRTNRLKTINARKASMMNRITNKAVLKTNAATLLVSSALGALAPAYAQTAAAAKEDAVEQIVVTGSRIARPDLQAASPIAVITSQDIKLSGSVNVENILNDLPQTIPGLTSSSNNPGDGTATIDLRGLGEERTLVLVNGRRYLPAGQDGIVDINTIPAGLIERVEVVTGGASATYGSDAIAGVVNFITKKNFSGVELSSQYGLSSRGDGSQLDLGALVGGDIVDGKGNITFYVGYSKRNPIFQGDRDFTRSTLTEACVIPGSFNPKTGISTRGARPDNDGNCVGTDVLGLVAGGSATIAAGRITIPSVARASRFAGTGARAPLDINLDGTADVEYGGLGLRFDETGSLATAADPADRFNFAPLNYLKTPQTRWLLNSTARYEINENFEVYAEGTFVQNRTNTQLAPTPATVTSADGVRLPVTSAFYGASTSALLNRIDLLSTGTRAQVGGINAIVQQTQRLNAAGVPLFTDDVAETTTTSNRRAVRAGNADDVLADINRDGFIDLNPIFIPVYTAAGSFNTVAPTFTADNPATDYDERTLAIGSGRTNADGTFTAGGAAAFVPDGFVTPGVVSRRAVEVGPRVQENTRSAYRATIGFRGKVFDGWTYDAYYLYQRTEYLERLKNDVSKSRFINALSGCANNATDGCVPVNIFGAGRITEAQANYLRVNATNSTNVEQQVASASITGTLAELPAGPLGLAFGGEWRKDSSAFEPDSFLATGDILGFTAGQPTRGSYSVKEVFGEVRVPILSDVPFVKDLTFEGGFRYSDYSTSGGNWTFKALGEWQVVDDLKIRGGYQRAVRAPNILELFQGTSNAFRTATDPCTDAQPTVNQTAAVRAICVATGVAASDVFAFGQENAQIESTEGGNSKLKAERATTYTIGAVIQPRFLPGFSASVDYYSISIKDAIGRFGNGTNNILNLCYNVIQSAASPYCQVISRRTDGVVRLVTALNANTAKRETTGIDLNINYRFNIGWGMFETDESTFNVGFAGTHVFKNNITPVQELPAVVNKCAGSFGSTCLEPDPKNRFTVSTSWTTGPLTLKSQVAWLSSVTVDNFTPGVSNPSSFVNPTLKAETYVDFSASFDVNDRVSFFGGINNAFDNKPTFLGDGQQQSNTFPSTYDAVGRRYFLGANFKF